MLPDTLVGLLVFAAAAGPGYFYVRLSQVRSPRHTRTTLEEAAEFVVFGALASAVGVLLALSLGKVTGLLDVAAISRGPAHYALTEPMRALGVLLVVVALSYGSVWIVTTKLLHRGSAAISPGETAWYAVFHRYVPDNHGVYGTVELDDGTAVAGLIGAYTVEADDAREVVLTKPVDKPLILRSKDGELVELPDTVLILPGTRIRAIGARYVPVA